MRNVRTAVAVVGIVVLCAATLVPIAAPHVAVLVATALVVPAAAAILRIDPSGPVVVRIAPVRTPAPLRAPPAGSSTR